jgi:isocitrate/isopropylmalate dehydrogenase
VTQLLVMEGDGIGPEICAATLNVLRAADRRFELNSGFTTATIGFAALKAQGTVSGCRDRAAKAADGVILGPVSQRISAGRARRAQSVGRDAPAPRSLRQYQARAHARRFSGALRLAGRSRDRAREH